MNDPICREALRLTWDLAQRQHAMIAKIIPAIGEVGDVLASDRKPTDEQLHRWQTLHSQLTADMFELTAAFEAILQLSGPLKSDS